MKKLIIEVIYDDVSKKVEVPYIAPSRVELPDEYPFNKNIYLGPDDGFSMRYLFIKEDGRIDYCQKIITLQEGVTVFSPFKHDLFVFHFEVKEQ